MGRTTFPFLLLVLLSVPAYAQQFGRSLAIVDETVFVSETRNTTFPGVVYVYEKHDTWQEITRLTASDADDTADRFGASLSADKGVLLVGASARNAVYVFEENAAGEWEQTDMLSSPSATEGDAFGSKVLLRGNRALITAAGRNERKGAVYVFARADDGSWTERAILEGDDTESRSVFGDALALDDSRALIGNPAEGVVYVFQEDPLSGAWQNQTRLAPEDLSERSMFGQTILMHGNRIYIGAPGFAGARGKVFSYMHDADTGEWTEQTHLEAFDAERRSLFGVSLSMDGDDLWVGAAEVVNGTGAIYRHIANGESWVGVSKLTATGLKGRPSFGRALAVHGDVAVVGATGVDTRQGAAVIFDRQGREADWQQRSIVVSDIRGYDPVVGEEVRCDEGEAVGWSCDQVDLVSFLPIAAMGGRRGTSANDIWGWTDAETGKEYALVGRSDGTAFVDVTSATSPIFVGDLPMTEDARASTWRDIKVYKNYAYIVADGAGEHGMQVFDLTLLRNVTDPPVTFDATVHYDRIHSAHNIVINEETGYAFSVGSSGGGETCGGGLHMIDIREPVVPTFVGCFADPTTGRRKTGYSHDAQCVIYHGPDAEHQGKEICFGSNETAISISDVTDKDNPVALSSAVYPNVAYTHQGWLTEDHRYFYMNDEGDEPRGLVEGTRTLIWDLGDLDDPILAKEFIAETSTTDHNLYIRGNLMYQSNYGSGLRILDIADPENPSEIGFFDTTPNEAGGGSWSNYPYFDSGIIVVTSIEGGLFVLRKRAVDI